MEEIEGVFSHTSPIVRYSKTGASASTAAISRDSGNIMVPVIGSTTSGKVRL